MYIHVYIKTRTHTPVVSRAWRGGGERAKYYYIYVVVKICLMDIYTYTYTYIHTRVSVCVHIYIHTFVCAPRRDADNVTLMT